MSKKQYFQLLCAISLTTTLQPAASEKIVHPQIDALRNLKTTVEPINELDQKALREARYALTHSDSRVTTNPIDAKNLPEDATAEAINHIHHLVQQQRENLEHNVHGADAKLDESEVSLNKQRKTLEAYYRSTSKAYREQYTKLQEERTKLLKKALETAASVEEQTEISSVEQEKAQEMQYNQSQDLATLKQQYEACKAELEQLQQELEAKRIANNESAAQAIATIDVFEKDVALPKVDTLRTELQRKAMVALLQKRQQGADQLRSGKVSKAYESFEIRQKTWLPDFHFENESWQSLRPQWFKKAIIKVDPTHEEVNGSEVTPFSIMHTTKKLPDIENADVANMLKDYSQHGKDTNFMKCYLPNNKLRCQATNMLQALAIQKQLDEKSAREAAIQTKTEETTSDETPKEAPENAQEQSNADSE